MSCRTPTRELGGQPTPIIPEGDSRRMRVLILCYELPPLGGGGSKVCMGLARALVELGHEVRVITSSYRGLLREDEIDGVKVHRVPTWRRHLDRSTPPELAVYATCLLAHLLRFRPDREADVCHVHFVFPDGLVAWLMGRLIGLRYVLTAHGSDVPGYNPSRFVFLHQLLAPLWRQTVRGAVRLVCASPTLANLVSRSAGDLWPAVIPNGFDPDRFSPARQKQEGLLCVARLFDRKGVQHLVAAVRELELAMPLHIVGDGPSRRLLEDLAQGSRTPVHFHGWLDNDAPELRELYERCTVFVLPSSAENFPVSLLEAMAAGMAIITTVDTGCVDVVADTALLVPSNDPVALREAILRLAADPALRTSLAVRARKRLERHFTWSIVAACHVELYHATLRTPRDRLLQAPVT